MKTTEIRPWPAAVSVGNEYNAVLYPQTGLYADDTGRVAVVNRSSNTVLWAYLPGFIGDCSSSSAGASTSDPGSVTELTLLKALAIAQNPILATELLK